MFTDSFYMPQYVIDDDVIENRNDLERQAKCDYYMAKMAAIAKNMGEYSINMNHAHWLNQLIAIHTLIDDYNKNSAEWTLEDSVEAFHKIIDIVNRKNKEN